MTVVALCSAKHSPGSTTLALALACAATEVDEPLPLVVEADPAGGDLAAHLGLPVSPGLVGLAAAFRHEGAGLTSMRTPSSCRLGAAASSAHSTPSRLRARSTPWLTAYPLRWPTPSR